MLCPASQANAFLLSMGNPFQNFAFWHSIAIGNAYAVCNLFTIRTLLPIRLFTNHRGLH